MRAIDREFCDIKSIQRAQLKTVFDNEKEVKAARIGGMQLRLKYGQYAEHKNIKAAWQGSIRCLSFHKRMAHLYSRRRCELLMK